MTWTPPKTTRRYGGRGRAGCAHWITDERRRALYERDGNACVYCDCPERFTLDHIIPRIEGGTHENENLLTTCNRCNASRKSAPLATFLARRGVLPRTIMLVAQGGAAA